MKNIIAIVSVMFLVACGAPVNNATQGFEEFTGVIIIADTLVGKTIFIDGNQQVITQDQLDKYDMGIAGSKDAEIEGMDVLSLELSQGDHELVVTNDGVIIFQKNVYVSDGQLRELRIK